MSLMCVRRDLSRLLRQLAITIKPSSNLSHVQRHFGVLTIPCWKRQRFAALIVPASASRNISGADGRRFVNVEQFLTSSELNENYDNEEVLLETTSNDTDAEFLAELLNVSRKDSQAIIGKYPEIGMNTKKRANFIYCLWTELGITHDQIAQNPWLLIRCSEMIRSRKKFFEELEARTKLSFKSIPHWAVVPLLQLSLKRINYYITVYYEGSTDELEFCNDFDNRVKYYAKELELSRFSVIRLGITHSYLFTRDFYRMSEALQTMKGAGIPASAISGDLKSLQVSAEQIKSRLEILKGSGRPLKTWMFRASFEPFLKSMEKWNKQWNVLDGLDRTTYLAESLNCSASDVEKMIRRYPKLLSVKPAKVKEMIELLLEEGFTREDIVSQPIVFALSVDSARKRCQELRQFGNLKMTLVVLAGRDYVKKLVAAKTNSMYKEAFAEVSAEFEKELDKVEEAKSQTN